MAIFLLFAAALQVQAWYPSSPPKIVADPIRAELLRAGYTRVPLLRAPRSTNHYIKAKCGDIELTLIVDTGAGANVLHTATAEKLKLVLSDLGHTRTGFAGSAPVKAARIGSLKIGTVQASQTHWDVTDLANVIQVVEHDDGFRFDGIIGSSQLIYYSSVLDIANNSLYFLDPITLEAGLQGEWVCTEQKYDRTVVNDDSEATRIRIQGSLVDFTNNDGATWTTYALALDLKSAPRKMDWIASNGGVHGGCYQLDKAYLTTAFPFYQNDDFSKRATKLDAGPGDKFTTLKFVRKPAKK